MTDLNEGQKRIAASLNGMILVDAGPGTGKTHTMVERYANILCVPEMDPKDVILMTFTNNAATEMKERLEERTSKMEDKYIQTSTFDAFCLEIVLESPESVTEFLGMKERLTRSARLVQNETLNSDYFQNFYTRFIKKYGQRYGDAAALTSSSVQDLYEIIKKLMSRGIMPLPDYEWFGAKSTILEGDKKELLRRLKEKNRDPDFLKTVRDGMKDMSGAVPELLRDKSIRSIPDELIEGVVNEDRRHLMWLVHDVYYEYIRSSISDNRLTFGLVELFALAVLYSDDQARKRFSYRYVMIDEFQDTNELQLKISLLILKEPNLCVVGDWKQGIYGFRNASIENIIDFEGRIRRIREMLNADRKRIGFTIPEVMPYPLVMNYRSSQDVIDAAFATLKIRGKKDEHLDIEMLDSKVTKITAERDDICGNTHIELIQTDTYDDEVLAVLSKIQEYITDPKYVICKKDERRRPRYGDIAILCRKTSLCRAIRDKAEEFGIPAYLQGDVEIMSTREGKLILAWLRYVNNRNDVMGPVAILTDQGYTLAEMETMFGRDGRRDNIPQDIVEQRKTLVRKKRRLNDLITSVFEYHGLNNDITQTIISVLSSAHRESLLTIPDVIRLIEEDIKRSTAYPVDSLLSTQAVTIQTMHKSKGLEYPIVIVAGINQYGAFPMFNRDSSDFKFHELYGIRSAYEYVRSGDYHTVVRSWKWPILKNLIDTNYDEERRLFFVALSRAKQYVTMTAYKPSNFMLAFGENNIRHVKPSLEKLDVKVKDDRSARPAVEKYSKRRTNVSVHDLMDMPVSVGKGDEAGKGTDYGIKVHEAAQLMAAGKKPKEDLEELAEVQRILDSLKGADILTEVDCTLPVGDVMIRGVIDLLAVFPDRVEVHDYKTDVDKSNLERYKVQISVYAHVASSYFNRPAECRIDFVSLRETVKVQPFGMDAIEGIIKNLRT